MYLRPGNCDPRSYLGCRRGGAGPCSLECCMSILMWTVWSVLLVLILVVLWALVSMSDDYEESEEQDE